MGKIIIAGQEHGSDFGPIYKHFGEYPFWNATNEYCTPPGGPCGPNGGAYSAEAKNKGSKRYARRPALKKFGDLPNKIEPVQAVVKKFILHHDGVSSSEICWNVLHNERGLSCHYLIDNDGTIYQTLDLALMGFHAAAFNTDSIGVEFCNRGIMDRPDFYAGKADPHFPAEPYKINNHTIRSFDFTEKQYVSFFNLSQALVKLLPNLAMEYPRDPMNPSKAAWGTLGPVDAEGDSYPASSFAGFLGHYHCTTRKWDPGPFDFKKWVDKLRGQKVFPVRVAGSPGAPTDKPVIPEDVGLLAAAVQPYYDANELTAEGGFFPVGPWGVHRLWHGGIHLPAAPGDPVYAPFPGRVIAARTGSAGGTPIGSNNFVLIRHDLNVASQQIRVYSLFMHLADETGTDTPSWMAGTPRELDPTVGVNGYDEVVDAGAIIGHVGTVGPEGLSKPQLHFEIFSAKRWFDPSKVEGSPFELIDGTATGRFCDDERIDTLIDGDKDGRMSRKELADFYDSGDKAEVRNLVTFHVSEWHGNPDWAEELLSRPDQFQKTRLVKGKRKKSPLDDDDDDQDVVAMVDDQLVPFLWWTDPVSKALNLPADAKVFHYHPMRFIEYVNGVHKDNAVVATGKVIDDNEDVSGASAFKEVVEVTVTDAHLKIENMVEGYDGDVPP